MFLPYAEYLPDQADWNNPGSSTILNVVPRTDQSYSPFPGMATLNSNAIADTVIGAVGVKDSSANIYNFAATSSHIYELNASTFAWADVTNSGGAYSVSAGRFWQFTQFNDMVIACASNANIQKFQLGVDTAFSDLASAAPQARYCTVAKDFLLVAATVGGSADTSTPGSRLQRVWWPKIGDPTTWPTLGTATAAADQSDAQDLVGDIGHITGIVGNNGPSDATVYAEKAVFQAMYIGSPDIWGFYPRMGVRGCVCPRSIQLTELGVIYLGQDDFYLDAGVGYPIGIGNQKIARTFYNDIYYPNLIKCQSALDPYNKLYYFAYPSAGGNGSIDTILICNYSLKSVVGTPGRWSKIKSSSVAGEFMFIFTSPGYNVDTSSNTGFNVDTCPYGPDDPFWTGGQSVLGFFDLNHNANTFNGNNLACTLQTSEKQIIQGKRSAVQRVRPIGDGGTATVTPYIRNNINVSPTAATASTENTIGDCFFKDDEAFYHRYQADYPANTTFTHLSGVDIPEDAVSETGER